MSLPQPPTNVEGHCSAIVDDVLYVLSPGSFLSLPVKEKAQWRRETPPAVPVIGAACVTVGEGADTELYVVGGATDDMNFSGLQKYSFSSKKWQALDVAAPVLQRRTEHSVAYLADSQQILVYAGSQPQAPSYLSSQTFVISTQEPHSLQSYTSTAPPGHLPIMTAWNSSHAVMLGGSDINYAIYTFGPYDAWQPLSTALTQPIDPSARATIIDGSDGSKVLELYDMHVTPNQVSQIVLLGEYGQPAYTGETVGNTNSSRKRKRDLTLGNWPTYNNKNAPSIKRTDCAVAQSSDGLAVISGGSSEAPVALFDQTKNSWVDADKFFNSKNRQQPLQPTKTKSQSSSTPSSTSSSSPSSSSTSAISSSGGESAHDRMLRTLGITLGVLCGIAAIFIIVLLYLRWRKMKKRKAEGYLDEKNNEENERMSFADRGASFMKEAGGSVNNLAAVPMHKKPWDDQKGGSHSSLAIITGRFNGKRNTYGHEPKPSYDSTSRLVRDKDGTPMTSEPVELVNLDEKRIERKPVARTEPTPPVAQYGPTLTANDARTTQDAKDRRKRSSGWSKYFATSQPTGPNGLSHLPSAYNQNNMSQYTDGSVYSADRTSTQQSHIPSSALVAPLDIDFKTTVDGQRLSHVATGSPAINDSREDLAQNGGVAAEGQKGLIVDPKNRKSEAETISSYNRSTMSSTSGEYHRESATPWTPTSTSFKDHLNNRPTSSVYAPSEPRLPSRGKNSGFFPGAGTSYRPSPKAAKNTPVSTSSSENQYAGLHFPKPPERPPEERDSTMTVFPKGVPSAYYEGRQRESQPAKPVNSDLGWLNLGLNANNSQGRL